MQSEELWNNLQTAFGQSLNWQIQKRRDLHQIPETNYLEYKTSSYLQNELKKLDIPFTTQWGVYKDKDKATGIVAYIGSMQKPCVMLRSDIDGLPIKEKTDLPFASTNSCMHACGHDIHMSVLLGVAKYLKSIEKDLKGTVRLIFQPAEEGGGGAKRMVDEGCLNHNNLPTLAGFALHVNAASTTGQIISRPATLFAAAINFKLEICGSGGHASAPYLTKDPIAATAQIISQIYTYTARQMNNHKLEDYGVISITSVQTADSYNVIPSSVMLKGTIRAFTNDKLHSLWGLVQEIASKTAVSYGQTTKSEVYFDPYPVTNNDHKLFEWIQKHVNEAYKPNGLSILQHPFTGSEDFSFFANEVPCSYFMIGANPPGHEPQSIHSDTVIMDENCIAIGSTLMAFIVHKVFQDWHDNKFPY